MSEAITYKVFLDDLTKHFLTVECRVKIPSEEGQIISLPAWVPGSYLIRDFAKYLINIQAESDGRAVVITKIEKNTWRCAPCTGELLIKYQVYGFDLMPRGAYIDQSRVFFDGCRIFLVVDGEEEQSCSVEIVKPTQPECSSWRCITSMEPYQISKNGFGIYTANNHLELIDHPFEISDFIKLDFTVANVPHVLVIAGTVYADLERLVRDVERICIGHVNFFGELPPMRNYVFFLNVIGKGYGGIEHRSSSSLLCSRNDLPIIGDPGMSEEYKYLLGLFSHEYFHLWNVKRIKPEVFTNLDIRSEVYTRQLWIFEGITSYFDNLNLVRNQIITPLDYLKMLQKDITTVMQNPGSNTQTVEDSSFDAWIKFYQPDENSINTTVSYYLKGALIGLALDLLIIINSNCKQSLADIMQVLWQQYGKVGLGLPENHFERVTYEVTGEDYSEFFALALRTTLPLPLPELLLSMGVIYKTVAADFLDNLGVRFTTDPVKLVVKSVVYGSNFELAGLAPNDIIIAVNNIAVNFNNLEAVIQRYKADNILLFHVFRNEVLIELKVRNFAFSQVKCQLELSNQFGHEQELNWKKWLIG